MLLDMAKRKFNRNYFLDCSFNGELSSKILDELKYCESVDFGIYYNFPIDNLSNNIKKISLGNNFNQQVDNLPIGLKYIKFGYFFDKTIDYLPSGLEHLTLSGYFNKPIDYLPIGLKYLIFNDVYPTHLNKFQQFSLNNLPNQLIKLKLNNYYNRPIEYLPSNLKYLHLGIFFNQKINNLPDSLIRIEFANNSTFMHKLDKLPDNLSHLVFNFYADFNESINYNDKLISLTLPNKYNKPLNFLPDTIVELNIFSDYPINSYELNPNIKFLKIPSQREINYLPEKLEILEFLDYNRVDIFINPMAIPQTLLKIICNHCELVNKQEISELYPNLIFDYMYV